MLTPALILVALTAAAEPPATVAVHVIRMATAAPEGTAWAREIHAMSRAIEQETHGTVRLKWYLGGIAGDELQMGERVRRDQLDGVASGGMLCTRLAPSMRVLGVQGLFQDRAEAMYVAGRLKPILDEEFSKNGFTNLTELSIGPQVLFMRTPVNGLADLRKQRLWVWDLDEVDRLEFGEMGVPVVATSLEDAAHAYDAGKHDGFMAVPPAALAFQWSTLARFLSPLRIGVLTGCFIVSNRAFDSLPLEAQQIFRAVEAKAAARLEEVGRTEDEALLGGLFSHQGLSYLKVSDRFRAEFLEAAATAREHLGNKLVPEALLLKVTTWLADFRAEHGGAATREKP
jgi:TRAP-type C4-dicarboxylate transport system substrate-binding protein